MMVLPVVFTVFFAFFPSGLVLYWVVNNTLSIAQQYVITRADRARREKIISCTLAFPPRCRHLIAG